MVRLSQEMIMDPNRFEALLHSLTRIGSRRRAPLTALGEACGTHRDD
jgi:hypothetical protein